MDKYKISFAEVDWESPMQGVRHKIVIYGNEKLRLVEFSPGMAPHWCEVGHIGQILDGVLEIEFGDGVRVFEKGDGVVIPSGAEHRHKPKALTDVVRAIFVEKV